MKLGTDTYSFDITSANDRECLTLECSRENQLLLEAVLTDPAAGDVLISQHMADLPLALVEEFVRRVRREVARHPEAGAT